MTHDTSTLNREWPANAPLTPTGRLRLARLVVEQNWPLARAAERFSVAVTTAKRWADRYRAHGRAGMLDWSCRPRSSPQPTPLRVERRAVGLRVTRRWGPARIAYHLRSQGLAPSTVHRILRRYQCPPLVLTDPATGTRTRSSRRAPRSYTHQAPGDLVSQHREARPHPGRGRPQDARPPGRPPRSRQRAEAYFAAAGITVARVMADSGSCYRFRVFATVLGEQITHRFTRPYRPQINGKVERFNRTALEEWVYARCYTTEAERTAVFRLAPHL